MTQNSASCYWQSWDGAAECRGQEQKVLGCACGRSSPVRPTLEDTRIIVCRHRSQINGSVIQRGMVSIPNMLAPQCTRQGYNSESDGESRKGIVPAAVPRFAPRPQPQHERILKMYKTQGGKDRCTYTGARLVIRSTPSSFVLVARRPRLVIDRYPVIVREFTCGPRTLGQRTVVQLR
jgi:hypothetical protein